MSISCTTKMADTQSRDAIDAKSHAFNKRVTHASASFVTLTRFSLIISRISRKLAEKLKCREIMVIVKCLN